MGRGRAEEGFYHSQENSEESAYKGANEKGVLRGGSGSWSVVVSNSLLMW